MEPIVICDSAIVSFYKENPNIDIISINHIFIDILKKLSTNLNETLANNINAKILSTLSDLSKDVQSLKQDVSFQLQHAKNDYIENVKLTLANYLLTNNEKTQHIMEKNTDMMITKTANIINDIIPKHHSTFHSTMDDTMKQLQMSILNDTNKLIHAVNKDDKTISDFVNNIDAKFNQLILNIQQPIVSCIQQNEDRTSSNIQLLRDKMISQQTSQDKLSGDMHDFLNKYKHNSSSKGNVSEHELYCILQEIFKSDQIINCSTETATCDYRVNRCNPEKPTILFENKDYMKQVTTEEVSKFERDLKLQQQHGVFISQNSSITFQIDIINNLIHIYIPNAKYNIDKIRTAVEIIDNLSVTINALKQQEETTINVVNIDKQDLDELLSSYNHFNAKKTALINTIMSSNKQIMEQLQELHMDAVKKILGKNNSLNNVDDFCCQFCNSPQKGKAGLSIHMSRYCKINPESDANNPKKNKKSKQTGDVTLENIVVDIK